MPFGFQVEEVTWRTAHTALAAVRRAVFIEEQHVPEEMEWDEFDAVCVHVLATGDTGQAIGTGRLLLEAGDTGRIGRMAVLATWRGRGVGAALLQRLIHSARQRGIARLSLHAQLHAASFYAKYGFTPEGDEFMEAGIAHVTMGLMLS